MKNLAPPVLVALAALSAPAFAQDAPATLRVETGTAMVSDSGGQFESANTGRTLDAGDKVMVNADSRVTLQYGNGCTMVLSTPGVYNVPGTCTRAAWARTGNPVPAGLIIAGVAVLGAAAMNSMDDVPPGPLSTGRRHF